MKCSTFGEASYVLNRIPLSIVKWTAFLLEKVRIRRPHRHILPTTFQTSLNCLQARASTLRTLLFAQSDFEYFKVFQTTPVTNKQIELKLTSSA